MQKKKPSDKNESGKDLLTSTTEALLKKLCLQMTVFMADFHSEHPTEDKYGLMGAVAVVTALGNTIYSVAESRLEGAHEQEMNYLLNSVRAINGLLQEHHQRKLLERELE